MFEVYGRNNCVWCERAKALLNEKGLPFAYYNIEEDSKALHEFKFIFRGAKTVPQICIGMYDEVEVIGGYEDLVKWLKQSTLKS